MRQICLIVQLFFCFTLSAQQSIGYLNVNVLLDSLPSHKEALLKLEMCRKDEYTVLQEMQNEMERIYYKWENSRICCTGLSIIKQEEEKLQKLQSALIEREKEIEELLLKYKEELNKPILDRIQKAIEIVAERKKLSYVIDESAALYFKGGIDCTAEAVIEVLRLDAEALK